MQTEFKENVIDFVNEPEPVKFLSKKEVLAKPVVLNVVSIFKVKKTKKDSKEEYFCYQIIARDEFVEWTIDNVFRCDMKWGKISIPTMIRVTATHKGETTYLDWKIESA